MVKHRGRITSHRIDVALKCFSRVEVASRQISATVDRSRVGHLHDPRLCRAFGTIEDARFPLDEKKQVLYKVFCFSGVSQDSGGDTANESRVSQEQTAQGFLVILLDARHQHFICWFRCPWRSTHAHSLTGYTALIDWRDTNSHGGG